MNYQLLLSILLAFSLFACQPNTEKTAQVKEQESTTKPKEVASPTTPEKKAFDWQGHRGARGLVPENTISAFIKALEFPDITTLELDVVISKDSMVVVSHEPWMSHTICSKPNGQPVTESEEKKFNIFEMNYSQIKRFDCGSRGNEKFPAQEKIKAYKPLLNDVVYAVERYCQANGRALPNYNIELKTKPDWYSKFTPPSHPFARLVLEQVDTLGIAERTIIQSFDPLTLNAVKKIKPQIPTAYLVETGTDIMANIRKLGFTPEIYSPYHKSINKPAVEQAHRMNMQVIPWTVNSEYDMKDLVKMGVDGIITDYPDKIRAVKSIAKMD